MLSNYTIFTNYIQLTEPALILSGWDETTYEASTDGLYLPQNNLGAEENELDNFLEHAKQERSEIWNASRVMQGKLKYEFGNDYDTRAQLQIEAFSKHPPDYLHTTGAKRKRAAKKRMNSPKGKAFLEQAKDLHFGSFHWSHIGLGEAYRYPELFFKPEVAQEVLGTLTELCDGIPFMWKMELGRDKDNELGESHVHAFLGQVPKSLKHLAYEDSEILKPIKGREIENKFRYLEKPYVYFQPYSYALYLEENENKEGYRLPNLRGFRNIKKGAE